MWKIAMHYRKKSYEGYLYSRANALKREAGVEEEPCSQHCNSFAQFESSLDG